MSVTPESTSKEREKAKEPHVVPADLYDWRSAVLELFSAVIRSSWWRGWKDLTRQCLGLGKGWKSSDKRAQLSGDHQRH